MPRSLAVLALLAVLLAGCSGDGPRPDAAPVDDEPTRQSQGGGDGEGDNATRVWEHTIVWAPDASPAATTMLVPTNLSSIWVDVFNQPSPPANCGLNVGDPASDDPLPFADFVSPSGVATRVSLLANECRAGTVSVYSSSSGYALDSVEPGTWQVSFSGRGAGLQQRLVVEGQPA